MSQLPKKSPRTYLAIDLKSFYASVECVARGLDPLTTNLVVADESRTQKTICLAVSPSLKKLGTGGRPRLFEVVQRVEKANRQRRANIPSGHFSGKSVQAPDLEAHPDWEIDYIIAPPRMAHYIEVSTRIYDVYLQYFSDDDIYSYSIDEVFIDATQYLHVYGLTAEALTRKVLREILRQTGITATAGIGSNLFLCKVAMDVVAKHATPDRYGARIAHLDERSFREQLWDHRPLTDIWRFGRGLTRRLQDMGIDTLGKLARCSLTQEKELYQAFGVNAELIVDHAWGWEPCTISQIKAYAPKSNSISHGQVLSSPYTIEKARVVALEMIDVLTLELVAKKQVASTLVLHIGYDAESLTRPEIRRAYRGEIETDYYGRSVPRHSQGTIRMDASTSSTRLFSEALKQVFDQIATPPLLIRRITITLGYVVGENSQAARKPKSEPPTLFTDIDAYTTQRQKETEELSRERRRQEAILHIKKQFGKNAMLRGLNFAEGATARDRNQQIGGHKA